MSKIVVAGIGPGSPEDITPAVLEAVRKSDIVVGYKYYFRFVEPYLTPGTQCVDTGMRKERERACQAFQLAREGHDVCVISSGDAGIYGMAPLIWEMKREEDADIDIEVLPGISAFQKTASILGAPIGHDLCIISLSDLMTPWSLIEKRIRAAAMGDFVTCIYNPKSHGRYWQLHRLRELFLQERPADNVVGFVRQAGRPEQEVTLTTLQDFDPELVDMFTCVIIGNSQSYQYEGRMITPRGYYTAPTPCSPIGERVDTLGRLSLATPSPRGGQGEGGLGVGASIMNESFHTILSEMKDPNVPLWRLWPLLHAIHTTVDFGMEECLWMDERATEILYNKVKDGTLKHIVTDSNMAASGIRKGALSRLGIEVHCFVADPEMARIAKEEGITRSQACMRHAATLYPEALYVVGNAPTALFEICDLTRKGLMHPAGIIAAPVGFVHVCESKHAVKTLRDIPKMIVEGRKGGSNIAATLVNSILTYDDAEQLKPGRDLI